MRFRPRRFPLIVLAAALVLLGARAAWRLSQTEIGWETHRREWKRALSGLVGLSSPRLSSQEPEPRARFWLAEVDRVLGAGDDPTLAAGAAWVLDAPELDLWARSPERRASAAASPGIQDPSAGLGRVLTEYYREEDQFDARCAERCLELTQHATTRAPSNSELWRCRALLLFRLHRRPAEITARRADWRNVLDECAAHDPGNALYDYLAALRDWTDSAAIVSDQSPSVLAVKDQEPFDRGDARFAAALEKPWLKFGSDGQKMALAFLEKTSLAPLEKVAVAESCGARPRAGALLLSGLYRWERARQNLHRQQGHMDAVVKTFRDLIHVGRQIQRLGNTKETVFEPPILMQAGLTGLKGLTISDPDLLDEDEAAKIDAELAVLKQRTNALLAAVKRIEAGDRPDANPLESFEALLRLGEDDRPPARRREWRALAIVAVTMPLAGFFLCAALAIWLVAWPRGTSADDAASRLGLIAHLGAWCLGLAASFVVFGLCPAGVISGDVQVWALRALVFTLCLVPSAIAIFLVHQWQRNRSLTTQAGAVLVLLGLALACGAAAHVADAEGVPWRALVTDGPFDPPWRDLSAQVAAGRGLWMASLLQWLAYSGVEVGAVAGMLFLALWSTIRIARGAKGGLSQIARSEKRRLVRATGLAVAKSFAVAGALMLLFYLAAAPVATDALERSYQRRHARLADPGAGWRELEAELSSDRRAS